MFKLLLSIDDELLKGIDEARSLHGTGRSEYIRRCIKQVLKIKLPQTKEELDKLIERAIGKGEAYLGTIPKNDKEKLYKEYPELRPKVPRQI